MDFKFTDEQLALKDTLQKFIGRDYQFERRRGFAGSALGYSSEAWAQYAELGLLSLSFPEEYGGLGGGGIDLMLVMELVGRGLLLEPFLSTVVICGGLIRDAGSHAMKQDLLPRIGAGKLKMALACYEAAGRYDLTHIACSAVGDRSGGWRLSGQKTVVLDGPSADFFLVSARCAGTAAHAQGGAAAITQDVSVFLVARDAPGVTLFNYPTQCGGRAADLRLNEVVVGADALIGGADGGLPVVRRAVEMGIAALCAEAVGIMCALNEATLTYLKTRKQFAVPIGKFQVLQHRMADMLIATEQARSMAIIATLRAEPSDRPERARVVSGAKAYIGQAARFVGQQAVQLHGAMGRWTM